VKTARHKLGHADVYVNQANSHLNRLTLHLQVSQRHANNKGIANRYYLSALGVYENSVDALMQLFRGSRRLHSEAGHVHELSLSKLTFAHSRSVINHKGGNIFIVRHVESWVWGTVVRLTGGDQVETT